jgi:hypothetical protein
MTGWRRNKQHLLDLASVVTLEKVVSRVPAGRF